MNIVIHPGREYRSVVSGNIIPLPVLLRLFCGCFLRLCRGHGRLPGNKGGKTKRVKTGLNKKHLIAL